MAQPRSIKRSEITNVDKELELDFSGPGSRRSEVVAYVGNKVEQWRMKRGDAVNRIRNEEEEFFTRHTVTGQELPVTIYKDVYLRSERDETKEDNLDELPPCGAMWMQRAFL